ncbi:hypothetical protein ABZ686_11095, partial [Streptomyces sp. NPDC006992]|uniref:hypothetical protein n=1 Tax=Streptomyces sp. NPDC006992 TaxID=3155601 RepID=UPI003404932A
APTAAGAARRSGRQPRRRSPPRRRHLPACDRRLHHFSGRRAFTEDEAIRAALDELLTAVE